MHDAGPGLWAPAAGRVYGPRALEDLRGALAALAANTEVREVDDHKALRLKPDGATAEGLRFTRTGLRQCCAQLAAGLFAFVEDLCGARRAGRPDAPPGSVRDAAAAFDAALALRGARLEGRCRLVVDLGRRTIDGVLGPGYSFLDNLRLLEAAEDAASASGRDLVYAEGALGDRRLSLRWADRGSGAEVAGCGRWLAGLFAVNGETGEQSAAASALLVEPRARLYALAPAAGTRAAHAGVRLGERLRRTLDAAAAAVVAPEALRAALAGLAAARLPVPAADDRDRRPRALGRLAAALGRAGVPRGAAERAVALAVAGRDAPTRWDLYRATAAVAQSLGQPTRERAERAAYAQLRLPDSMRPSRRDAG